MKIMQKTQQISKEIIIDYYNNLFHNSLRREAIEEIIKRTGLKKQSVRTYLRTGKFQENHRKVAFNVLNKYLTEQNKILQYD